MTLPVTLVVLAAFAAALVLLTAPHAPRLFRHATPPARPRRFWLTLIVAREIGTAGMAAAVVDIQVNKKSGKITATNIFNAIDVGLAVNPGGVENQISGGSIMGLSRILHEQVVFNKSHVTSLDWVTYPILRFAETPKVTNVVLQQTNQLPLGAGEPGITPIPGAVANAFFDATGVRLRSGPFTPARVRAGLKAAGVA